MGLASKTGEYFILNGPVNFSPVGKRARHVPQGTICETLPGFRIDPTFIARYILSQSDDPARTGWTLPTRSFMACNPSLDTPFQLKINLCMVQHASHC